MPVPRRRRKALRRKPTRAELKYVVRAAATLMRVEKSLKKRGVPFLEGDDKLH